MITFQNSTKEKARPSGDKRALKLSRQFNALKNWAKAIEKIAKPSNKKCKIFQEMLDLDCQRLMIDLFSPSGTDEKIKSRFLKLTQLKALESLERMQSRSSETQNTVNNMVHDGQLVSLLHSPYSFAEETPYHVLPFIDSVEIAHRHRNFSFLVHIEDGIDDGMHSGKNGSSIELLLNGNI